MKKQKTTKRSLVLSALALFVCIAMFIGSTFAWFTDSVTSGNNKIASGNLDVVLEYKTDWDDGWTVVDENTKIFKEGALYEPGYTEVVFLRVSNAGSLALKYNLMVDIASETGSTSVNGTEFKLSDYLQIGTYTQDEYSSGFNYADILMPSMFGTRKAALAEVSKNVPGVTPLTKLSEADSVVKSDDPILAGEQTAKVMAIVLTMPETVGNEANYDATVDTAPEIDLGISLVATQYTEESDSFNNQYDANADFAAQSESVHTADEFIDALEKGKGVILANDITLSNALTVEDYANIDLNGHTLSTKGFELKEGGYVKDGTVASNGDTNFKPHLKATGGTLKMDNVTVDVSDHLNANVYWTEATGMEVANAKAVLNNCDIKIHNETKAQWVYSYGISLINAELTMNGGSITATCVAGTAANGPTNPNAISTMEKCIATLNNVDVEATYYVTTVDGHCTINTTDKTVVENDIVDNQGGSHTLNYID